MATIYGSKGRDDFAANASYEGGAGPATGDTVYWLDSPTAITAGVSNPGIDLLALYFGQGHVGNIGADGSPLIIDVDRSATGVCQYLGGADVVRFQGGTGGTWNKLVFDPIRATRLYLTTMLCSNLEFCNGIGFLAESVALTNLRLHGGEIDVPKHASVDITLIEAMKGILRLARDFTTMYIGGEGRVGWNGYNITGGAVNMSGGTLEVLQGSLGTVTGKAGVIDFRNLKRSMSVTIDQGTPSLTVYYPSAAGQIQPTISYTNNVGTGPKRIYA